MCTELEYVHELIVILLLQLHRLNLLIAIMADSVALTNTRVLRVLRFDAMGPALENVSSDSPLRLLSTAVREGQRA